MKKSGKKQAKIIVRRASNLLAQLRCAPAWISAAGGTVNACAVTLALVSGCNYRAAHAVLHAQGWTSERLAAHLDNQWGREGPKLNLSALFFGQVIIE